jgi:hypothetical protein
MKPSKDKIPMLIIQNMRKVESMKSEIAVWVYVLLIGGAIS